MFEIDPLKRIIEAALLASSHPLTLPQLSNLFDELDMPPHEDLAKALAQLREDCAGRGVELVEVASGFRYQVCQDAHRFVTRLWSERQSRYSRALLETLSLIAYRQPITRPEIEQIRGVAVSTHIVRTLEEREWVRVVGYRDVPGKPALFGTTKQFLDYFNLKSLDELPPLSELRDIEELDPQLVFGAPGEIIASVDMGDESASSSGDECTDSDSSAIENVDPRPSESIAANGDTASSPSISEEPLAGNAEKDSPESVA